MSEIEKLIQYSNYDEIIINDEKTLNMKNLDCKIMDENHSFIGFVKGFIHNSIDIDIIHGWYHIESKKAKFIVGDHPSIYGDIIHLAWQKYWNNNGYNYDVSIYSTYCGQLYESNEFDIDNNKTLKKVIKLIL
jgi:hypothetical protein